MLRANDGSMDEVILEMWKDGMQTVQCKSKDRIYFEDFQCFFKGNATITNQNQGMIAMDTVQEDSESCLSGRASKMRMSKRMSVSSSRLLASTFALDVEGNSESLSSFDFEKSTEEIIASLPQVVPGNRSSFRTPTRRRSSGCAVLVQQRSIGVLE